MNSFVKRSLSAVILAPLVLGVLYLGGPVFLGFICLVMAVAVFEWARMALKLQRKDMSAFLLILGCAYIAAALGGVYDIRENQAVLCVALLLAIWGSDIGGYMFGKFIGGPKMAPKISPNKTWAGLFGACFMPVLVMVGMGVFWFDGAWDADMALLGASGIAVGILGQAGDLTISRMKRAVAVKDTGNLIPGHGGILDRIDALLLVFLVFWGLTATGIMAWPFVQ